MKMQTLQNASASKPTQLLRRTLHAPFIGHGLIQAILKVVLVAILSTGAWAQAPGGGPPGGPPGGGRGGGRPELPPGGTGCPPIEEGPTFAQRVGTELRGAKDALRLSNSQLPEWAIFEERSQRVLQDVLKSQGPKQISRAVTSAPQRIDLALDYPRNRLTALEEVSDSAKRLYESLSTEQRAVADGRLPAVVLLLATASSPGGGSAGMRPPGKP
jgi:hypothetical protein